MFDGLSDVVITKIAQVKTKDLELVTQTLYHIIAAHHVVGKHTAYASIQAS